MRTPSKGKTGTFGPEIGCSGPGRLRYALGKFQLTEKSVHFVSGGRVKRAPTWPKVSAQVCKGPS